MPLYEYRCMACHHKFGLVRPCSERRKAATCPQCRGMSMKLISTPSVVIDSEFHYTGKVDTRLGGTPIKGKRDWETRVKKKGFVPLTQHELKNM